MARYRRTRSYTSNRIPGTPDTYTYGVYAACIRSRAKGRREKKSCFQLLGIDLHDGYRTAILYVCVCVCVCVYLCTATMYAVRGPRNVN
jgi:hypothetical protein